MKKITSLFILLLSLNFLFAQDDYSFKIEKSGVGTEHIILIPGYTCAGEVWASTLQQLNPGFSCHTLTMAGFAGHKAQASPSIENWVEEIHGYIKKEKLQNVRIIGHSLGGVIAQWLAADYPDLVQQIIVVDALPCLPALSNPAFQKSETPDCSQANAMFQSMDDTQFEQMQKMNLPMMTTNQEKHELLLEWSMSSDRNTLSEIFCQLMNIDLREKIASIKCPSLILLEANFKMMDTMIVAQYSNLKNAKLAYANKGMHFIMYDDPEWYLAQVNTFLK